MTSVSHSVIPLSFVIPTRNRVVALAATLASLVKQSALPAEVHVVDASDDDATRRLCEERVARSPLGIFYHRAERRGAACQRNQGVAQCGQPVLGFCDDDILFEPECLSRLWNAMLREPSLGGANATITNQMYSSPGRVTKRLYPFLNGSRQPSYAGRVLGPGVNLLPEDRQELPEIVTVDWLNLGCTLYRREALPDPPFPAHFTGYSLCEDLTLSLTVGRKWKLANVRTARIFHDSQPGDHKRSAARLAAMEIVNRHYVMTKILGRSGVLDYFRLGVWEAFQVAAAAQGGIGRLCAEAAGKVRGVGQLVLRELT